MLFKQFDCGSLLEWRMLLGTTLFDVEFPPKV